MEFEKEYYEARFKPKGEDTIVAGYCGETLKEAVLQARDQAVLRAEIEGGDAADCIDSIAVYRCSRVLLTRGGSIGSYVE